jgi:hypothetical protein
MIMRFLKYISLALVPLVMGAFMVTSCDDPDGMHIEDPSGPPVIDYIRLADPATSDSLIVSATLGTGIVLVGENLGGTREIWFNDKQSPELTPSWVTNRTVFVSVPAQAPDVVTNIMYVTDKDGNTMEYPFVVQIAPPEIHSARNEWPQDGEDLVINGDFFFEPITVNFDGGDLPGEIVSVSQNQLVVSVPDGATEGPVTVTTNFGEATSTFNVWDSRNIVLDFDTKVPNAWRIGKAETSAWAINGKYNVFNGPVAANQRDEGPGAPSLSGYLFEYWGGNDASRSDNFYPFYPNSYREYALKFEAKVDNWYGGYLNLCLSIPEHTGNNQEIWSNTYNARAIWGPWADAGEEFSTDGKWITVVVPMTEFQYFMGTNDAGAVVYTPGQKFQEAAAGSFSAWLLGSPENTGNTVTFYIDNVRFVQL